jgi:hypothetical protein
MNMGLLTARCARDAEDAELIFSFGLPWDRGQTKNNMHSGQVYNFCKYGGILQNNPLVIVT